MNSWCKRCALYFLVTGYPRLYFSIFTHLRICVLWKGNKDRCEQDWAHCFVKHIFQDHRAQDVRIFHWQCTRIFWGGIKKSSCKNYFGDLLVFFCSKTNWKRVVQKCGSGMKTMSGGKEKRYSERRGADENSFFFFFFFLRLTACDWNSPNSIQFWPVLMIWLEIQNILILIGQRTTGGENERFETRRSGPEFKL